MSMSTLLFGAPKRKLEAEDISLHQAALAGTANIVQAKLAAGEDPNAQDDAGCTVLLRAVQSGDPATVRVVLEHRGVDVNKINPLTAENPIIHTAIKGYEVICRMLIEAHANVNVNWGHECNLLECAIEHGYMPIVRMLIEAIGLANVDKFHTVDCAVIHSQIEMIEPLARLLAFILSFIPLSFISYSRS